ncbi:MAG TPA: regulatory protein RecX [Edaphocola sp.]|nr:regulatory protein RecX [Edaphocola sp.]
MSVSEAILDAIRHYCAYQERCHSEVRTKLISLKCYGEDLEEAISILIQENFLNEERYAIAYASGKFRINSWGKIKINLHLKSKGVSEYCIRKSLSAIDPEEYEQKLLQLTIKKDKALLQIKQEWKRKQKVIQYLLQKGFEMDLILNAWNSKEKL